MPIPKSYLFGNWFLFNLCESSLFKISKTCFLEMLLSKIPSLDFSKTTKVLDSISFLMSIHFFASTFNSS